LTEKQKDLVRRCWRAHNAQMARGRKRYYEPTLRGLPRMVYE